MQGIRNISSAPQIRALAWVLLLVLTTVLLLLPVNLISEYQPIQAPYIFDNLMLFGVLFCVWMLLILFLLFSKKDRGNIFDWENLALSCVFGLFFLGFWVVITPYGSFADGIFNMGHVRWLLDEGSIPVGHENLQYFDFPGMHLLVAALSLVTNLDIFASRALFLVVNVVMFTVLLYIFFTKLMKSGRLAFLGVIIVTIGSTLIVDDMTTFYPRALGFTLLAGFLVMLTRSETKLFGTTMSDRLLMLILFVAMTISYFATSFLTPLVLLGIFAVQILGRDTQARASLRTIILLLSIVIIWQIYWTWHLYDTLVKFLPEAWESLISGDFLTIPITLGKANIGARLPLWVTITRSCWWALIGFGTVLGLRNLFRLNKLGLAEKIVTGGLIGIILITVIGVFGTVGGQQFVRFLLYGPLFCIPILLMFLYKSGTWGKRGLTLLTALIFILALPTFLSSVNTVATDASYPYDVSAGKFLELHNKEKGEDYILYSITSGSRIWAYYNIPNVSFVHVLETTYYVGSEEEVWQEAEELVGLFQNQWALPETLKVFVMSDKDTSQYQHLLDVPPDEPKWEEIQGLLSSANKIFDNRHVQMYGQVYVRP